MAEDAQRGALREEWSGRERDGHRRPEVAHTRHQLLRSYAREGAGWCRPSQRRCQPIRRWPAQYCGGTAAEPESANPYPRLISSMLPFPVLMWTRRFESPMLARTCDGESRPRTVSGKSDRNSPWPRMPSISPLKVDGTV